MVPPLHPCAVFSAAFLAVAAAAPPTWPSPRWDELEWLIYQDAGHAASQFSSPFVPCSDFNAVTLRMTFHDVAGHVAADKIRGIDASLRYELNYTENVLTFNEVYFYITNFANQRLSISDAEVAAIVSAVANCDGPSVPLRAGRVDAMQPNPADAFRPSHTTDTISELIGNFSVIGFNQSEFITLIACAHTLGGVEHDEDPTIVSDADNKIMFDNTNLIYDHLIVQEYLDGTVPDPLIVGPAATNVDLRIFSSDGNVTISKLNSHDAYFDACVVSLAKALESVPAASVLSDVLVPYEVKPSQVHYDIIDNLLTFAGEIRVRITDTNVSSVILKVKDDGSKIQTNAVDELATGGYPTETFETINDTAVSQYSVSVAYANGTNVTFDNNGALFPIEPSVFYSTSLSCVSPQDVMNWTATIVAAIKSSLTSSPVNLVLTYGVRNPDDYVPAADLFETTIEMTKMDDQNSTASGYVLYSASFSINAWTQNQATFDIVVGTSSSNVTDAFHKLTDLVGRDCPANVVSLDWSLNYVNIDLGGTSVRKMIGVNGVWPPDAVYANFGDTLQINLASESASNQLDVPTALHFYGIHQSGSPQYDGYSLVTQCPIPSKSNFTYTVLLNQTGTFWIEGSYGGQSVDGLRVPLIVRSTSDPKYNNDYIVRLTEWYDEDYSSLFGQFSSKLNPLGTLPTPVAILANEQYNASLHFNTGETNMLRLISMASQLSMTIAIDAHNMTIVEIDGSAVEQYEVTSLRIAPGQRFGVLVTGVQDTNTTIFNYRMHITQQVANADADGTEAVAGALATLLDISYADGNPYATTIDTTEGGGIVILYNDTILPLLTPAVPTEVLKPTQQIILNAEIQMMNDGTARGTFNDIAYFKPAVPSLMTALSIGEALQTEPEVYGADTNPFILESGVTEIIILNQDVTNALPFDDDDEADDEEDDDDDDDTTSGFPTRDTVQIPSSSFAVLRFRNDNPGVWLLHCSNVFWRDFGFAATLVETPALLPAASTLDSEFSQTCAADDISFTGNAAGKIGTDMTGYVGSPPIAVNGTTPAFWGTLIGCTISLAVMIFAVYIFHIPDDVLADRLYGKKQD
ncbi:ferroxidase fet3 [Entophlyctis luteolus]|nr:ferroxidase fet3 [Entophlyctis luteolus]